MTRLINYAPAINIAYRHNLGELRQVLDTIDDWFTKSPGAKADVVATLKTFATATGLNLNNLPTNQGIVQDGTTYNLGPDAGGSYGPYLTAVVAAGVVGTFKLNPTAAKVDNAQSGISVQNSVNTPIANGTAVVSNNILSRINLPATTAGVNNAASVPLGDATAAANGQDNGTAAVAAGVVTRITLPTTDKILKSGVAYPVSGGSGTAAASATTITPTIVNGVITGFVLA